MGSLSSSSITIITLGALNLIVQLVQFKYNKFKSNCCRGWWTLEDEMNRDPTSSPPVIDGKLPS